MQDINETENRNKYGDMVRPLLDELRTLGVHVVILVGEENYQNTDNMLIFRYSNTNRAARAAMLKAGAEASVDNDPEEEI